MEVGGRLLFIFLYDVALMKVDCYVFLLLTRNLDIVALAPNPSTRVVPQRTYFINLLLYCTVYILVKHSSVMI